jgi:hypothetical protein
MKNFSTRTCFYFSSGLLRFIGAGLLICIFMLGCAEEDSLFWYVPKKPPLARCGIKSVNKVAYVSGIGVKPLDDVVLTANGSIAQMPGAKIVSYRWEKVWQPHGSMATLSDPAGIETGFIFADNVHGVDLAGNYRFKLIVTDSLGSENTDECLVKWSAIPSGTLHIQLVWDTNYGDMDLHLAKKDSQNRYCAFALNDEAHSGPLATTCLVSEFLECNYTNCRSFSENDRPNWDGESRKSDGDPSLDIDDLSGYGPENINIEHALGGSFLVSAHHFAGGRPSGNTVRLYLYGHLYAEFYRILKPNEWWEVAKIYWPENMSAYPCIEDLASQQMECPRPDALYYRDSSTGSSFTECSSPTDCGPGTGCDMETRDCVSKLNICHSDEDCPIEKRCILATQTCVIPECENDRQCKAMHNLSYKCNLSTYSCMEAN